MSDELDLGRDRARAEAALGAHGGKRWSVDEARRANAAHVAGMDPGDATIALLDRLAAAEAEVERLTLTDTELCQCPEGPYFGAQMAPSIPRCERCRRPSDPRVMALLAEVERLHRLVGEQTTKARDAITERDDLRRRHSHLQQRVLAVAMPEQILAILDAPQTDGGGAHDRRPEPGDGPEYAADLAAWLERNGGDGR